MFHRRLPLRCLFLTTVALASTQAAASDAVTYGAAFNPPVFNQVDQNGVDLVTGHLRVTSPVIETGSEENRQITGLQWVGSAWVRMDYPTIWRDGDKYIVNYRGQSEEFNDRSHNYSQRKPITGSTLSCSIYEPGNLASECLYTDRNGDVVLFKGMYSNITPYPSSYAQSAYAWGNLGMTEARVWSVDNGHRLYGFASPGGYGENYYYKTEFTISLGGQTLKIRTPNHASDYDEHYLRPDNTTQTITDSFGSVWQYQIDDSRRMTRITPPGGAGAITIAYYSSLKVKSVTTAAGTWNYAYSDSGTYSTTTVTDPYGKKTYVTSHDDHGYVTEHRDHLGNRTTYLYDTGHRLTRITYPEGNYVAYLYDARGNIIQQTTGPKPAVGGTPLVEYAGYPATCTDAVTCNRPLWIQDARGNRTDFTYQPSTSWQLGAYAWRFNNTYIRTGTGKPVTIASPAVGGVRPEVRNTYTNGMLTRSSICRTLGSCAGTNDEVVTAYDYGGTEASMRLLFGKAVTSAGITLRTCYGYDDRGRRISETPPIAGLGSCPASVTASPAVTATMPSAGTAPVAPTFPDGSTSEPPLPPPDTNCGPGTGIICP